MPQSSENYQCTICSRSYKRREHLQRHAMTHSTLRPHRCNDCNVTFTRSDILRRHTQTCSARSDISVSQSRRRACDRCSHQKKSCSLGQPCVNCARKNARCHYSFATGHAGRTGGENWQVAAPLTTVQREGVSMEAIDSDFVSSSLATDLDMFLQGTLPDFQPLQVGNDALDWLNFLGVSQAQSLPPSDCLDESGENRQFRFLYNFTSRTGLGSTFDCGSTSQRQNLHTYVSLETPRDPNHGASGHPRDEVNLEMAHSGSWLFDPLVIKIHDIVSQLKEIVVSKTRNKFINLVWTATVEQECLVFFSPSNIRKMLTLYWALWHPNVNFVHKPTFDAVQAKSSLLATMVVIGACVSPNTKDVVSAKTWFDCIEELVFTDEDFCYDLPILADSGAISGTQRSRIQALQAAYMVCLYQNWEGDDAGRRRIRRYRFSTLVSALRDSGSKAARAVVYDGSTGHTFDWTNFIAQEELVRTFLWIFLLDTCFVIFNNLPPRMVIKELQMRLACPESCFQASTKEECVAALGNWTIQSSTISTMSIRECIQLFCSTNMSSHWIRGSANTGPLNLFVVVSAFHILIFQRINSFSDSGHLGAIHLALHNWKAVWQYFAENYLTSPPHAMVESDNPELAAEEMWRRVGFMRHAHEFWLLANLIVDRMSQDKSRDYDLTFGDSDQATPIDSVLSEYDQNNMRQVNELITSFENARMI